MDSEAETSESKVRTEEEVEDEFGGAFDQPKHCLGQSDDDGDDDQPWRFIVSWRLRRGEASVPFPLDLDVKGCTLEGWLLPKDQRTRPVRVSFRNLDLAAFDREKHTRGWWIQTEPRKRSKGIGAFYWLQEAADPAMHTQSRAVLDLVSAVLDVVAVNERAPTQPITVALGGWFATMAEHGVEAKSVLARFQADVYTHVLRARPKLTPSCTFLKTLMNLSKQTQRKLSQDIPHFCTVAEEVSNRFPWGGERRMKRNVDSRIVASQNLQKSDNGKRKPDDDDDDEEEEEFEMSGPKVDVPASSKTVKRRTSTENASSTASAPIQKVSNHAHKKIEKKARVLTGGIETLPVASRVVTEQARTQTGKCDETNNDTVMATASADHANARGSHSKISAAASSSTSSDVQHSASSESISLNCRVEVYWPIEKTYFAGVVKKIGKKRFHVQYDDGDKGWVDFNEDKYRILEPPKQVHEGNGLSKSTVEEPRTRVPRRPSVQSGGQSGSLKAESQSKSPNARGGGPLRARPDSHEASVKAVPNPLKTSIAVKRKAESAGLEDRETAPAKKKGTHKRGINEDPTSESRTIEKVQGEAEDGSQREKKVDVTRESRSLDPMSRNATTLGTLCDVKPQNPNAEERSAPSLANAQSRQTPFEGKKAKTGRSVDHATSAPKRASKEGHSRLKGEMEGAAMVPVKGHVNGGVADGLDEFVARKLESRTESWGSKEVNLQSTAPGPTAKRQPTLLRIKLKKARKSVPRDWANEESRDGSQAASEGYTGEIQADTFSPHAERQVDLEAPAELGSDSTRLHPRTTAASASSTTATKLPRNRVEVGRVSDRKVAESTKSLAQATLGGKPLSGVVLPSEGSKPNGSVAEGVRGSRADARLDSSDTADSVNLDKHNRKGPAVAMANTEANEGVSPLIPNDLSRKPQTHVSNGSASVEHCQPPSKVDEMMTARSGKASHDAESRVSNPKEAKLNVGQEQNYSAGDLKSNIRRSDHDVAHKTTKEASRQATASIPTTIANSTLGNQATRIAESNKVDVPVEVAEGPREGFNAAKHDNRSQGPGKVPRRHSSLKEILKKVRDGAVPLAQPPLLDRLDDNDSWHAPAYPEGHPSLPARSFSSEPRGKATESGVAVVARTNGKLARAAGNNSVDPILASARETHVPSRPQVKGILRNPIKTRDQVQLGKDKRDPDQEKARREARKDGSDSAGEGETMPPTKPGAIVAPERKINPVDRGGTSSGLRSSSQRPISRDAMGKPESREESRLSSDKGSYKAAPSATQAKAISGAATTSRPGRRGSPTSERPQDSLIQQSTAQTPYSRSYPPKELASDRKPAPGSVHLHHGHGYSQPSKNREFVRTEPRQDPSSASRSVYRTHPERTNSSMRHASSHESRREWGGPHHHRNSANSQPSSILGGLKSPRSSAHNRREPSTGERGFQQRTSSADMTGRFGNTDSRSGVERGDSHRRSGPMGNAGRRPDPERGHNHRIPGGKPDG